MGRINFFVGILLLALLGWAASGGLGSCISPGDPSTGFLGAACLLAAFLYFLFRRTGLVSRSKGIWGDFHVFLGSVGVGWVLIHSGGIFFGLTGLLSLALALLFLLGLNLRFLSARQSYRNFGSRVHIFFNPVQVPGGLDDILRAKETLLRQIDPRAVEGTFRLRLQDWFQNPWKAGRYLGLGQAEKRWVRQICGSSPGYLNFSQGWGRYLHIGLGGAAVVGFLFHILQSCPYLKRF